jgi:hypothetical protein
MGTLSLKFGLQPLFGPLESDAGATGILLSLICTLAFAGEITLNAPELISEFLTSLNQASELSP